MKKKTIVIRGCIFSTDGLTKKEIRELEKEERQLIREDLSNNRLD